MFSRIKAKESASLHNTFVQMIATVMAEMPDDLVPAASALHENLP